MKYRPFHGIRFRGIIRTDSMRGKYLSYLWITSYKNSFYVGYGTIRAVKEIYDREKLNNEGSFCYENKSNK